MHLVEIGVLRPCGPTKWVAATVLKRKVHLIPIIQEVIQRRAGYKWFTKLDLSIFFYTLELDEESRELTTIVTPFGKFQYYCMAMGLKIAPDVAQAAIKEIMRGSDVETYMDDVKVFTNESYNEHMQVLELILNRLEENGMKVNPLKCEWA
eukprot:14633573-Ditylum_brightwellii.AAC.1